MATWKVEPTWKKSIVERQEMVKDHNILIVETGWRWGEFHVETEDDNPPDIGPGVDMFDCGYESEMIETTDGCWEDHDMEECDDETKEWLEEFFEDNSYFDLEEHGWHFGDCQMIIDCELKMTKLNEDGSESDVVVMTGVDEDEETVSEEIKPGAPWPFANATEPKKGE